MSTFEDRKKGFENKFVHDEEREFKISARKNKYIGEWASRIMGYNDDQTKEYIQSVIKADFAEAGDEIDEKLLDTLRQNEIAKFLVLITSNKSGAYIRNTIVAEKDVKRADALAAIYKIMRPGEPPTEESSEKLFYDLFFAIFYVDLFTMYNIEY